MFEVVLPPLGVMEIESSPKVLIMRKHSEVRRLLLNFLMVAYVAQGYSICSNMHWCFIHVGQILAGVISSVENLKGDWLWFPRDEATA